MKTSHLKTLRQVVTIAEKFEKLVEHLDSEEQLPTIDVTMNAGDIYFLLCTILGKGNNYFQSEVVWGDPNYVHGKENTDGKSKEKGR